MAFITGEKCTAGSKTVLLPKITNWAGAKIVPAQFVILG